MGVGEKSVPGVAEEDFLRAQVYGMLARLLIAPPSSDYLMRLTRIEGSNTPVGLAFADLAEQARAITPETAEEEFNKLFIGVTQGELVPFASYYLTGFLNDRPLAALRDTLAEFGIERTKDVHEPEDHIAFLCDVMSGLVSGTFGAPAEQSVQRKFFGDHIASWAPRFLEDLKNTETSAFYRAIGAVGGHFLAIEETAFDMTD